MENNNIVVHYFKEFFYCEIVDGRRSIMCIFKTNYDVYFLKINNNLFELEIITDLPRSYQTMKINNVMVIMYYLAIVYCIT